MEEEEEIDWEREGERGSAGLGFAMAGLGGGQPSSISAQRLRGRAVQGSRRVDEGWLCLASTHGRAKGVGGGRGLCRERQAEGKEGRKVEAQRQLSPTKCAGQRMRPSPGAALSSARIDAPSILRLSPLPPSLSLSLSLSLSARRHSSS